MKGGGCVGGGVGAWWRKMEEMAAFLIGFELTCLYNLMSHYSPTISLLEITFDMLSLNGSSVYTNNMHPYSNLQ